MTTLTTACPLAERPGFSWRRVYAFGMLYKRPIRVMLIVMTVVTIVGALNVQLADTWGYNSTHVFVPMSALVGFLVYFSPLTFAGRDRTIVALAPATAAEKFAFYFIYCQVGVPLYVDAIWYGIDILFGLFSGRFLILDLMMECKQELVVAGLSIWEVLCMGYLSLYSYVMLILLVELRSKVHTVAMPLLAFVCYGVASGILGGVTGFVGAFFFDLGEDKVQFVATIFWMTTVIAVIVGAVCTVLTWRTVKSNS